MQASSAVSPVSPAIAPVQAQAQRAIDTGSGADADRTDAASAAGSAAAGSVHLRQYRPEWTLRQFGDWLNAWHSFSIQASHQAYCADAINTALQRQPLERCAALRTLQIDVEKAHAEFERLGGAQYSRLQLARQENRNDAAYLEATTRAVEKAIRVLTHDTLNPPSVENLFKPLADATRQAEAEHDRDDVAGDSPPVWAPSRPAQGLYDSGPALADTMTCLIDLATATSSMEVLKKMCEVFERRHEAIQPVLKRNYVAATDRKFRAATALENGLRAERAKLVALLEAARTKASEIDDALRPLVPAHRDLQAVLQTAAKRRARIPVAWVDPAGRQFTDGTLANLYAAYETPDSKDGSGFSSENGAKIAEQWGFSSDRAQQFTVEVCRQCLRGDFDPTGASLRPLKKHADAIFTDSPSSSSPSDSDADASDAPDAADAPLSGVAPSARGWIFPA